jgi:hypothetical protein
LDEIEEPDRPCCQIAKRLQKCPLRYSDPDRIRVAISLPTFRRPDHLVMTLNSLEAQAFGPRWPSSSWTMTPTGSRVRTPPRNGYETHPEGLVIVAHQRGNCHAYNAGWETALAEFPRLTHIAVIDDDELAGPGWLDRGCSKPPKHRSGSGGRATGAGVCRSGARCAGAASGFPARITRDRTGSDPLFVRQRADLAQGARHAMPHPFLDPAFNFIGGGDSDFYRRAKAAGFSFAWCAEAVVMETLPSRRAEFSWLNARSLRNGAISAIHRETSNPGLAGRLRTARQITGPSCRLALARCAALGFQTGSAVIGLYHIQVAAGRLMAEFGLVNEQYRNPESN